MDCTFVTDFDNHIYVTTDAEAFFFLHDLISSYLKEKERVLNIQHGMQKQEQKTEQKSNEQNGVEKESEKLNRLVSIGKVL